jgi:uncharacterized protein YkwD
MMMAKMLICASILAAGSPPGADEKPCPDGANNSPQAAQPVSDESLPTADTSDKPQEPPATPPEMEEKEINGVKLLPIEANIVSCTNEERVRRGLPPLEVDKELMETAREHCSWMTLNRSMVHTRRPVAENIAMGQPRSDDVVRAWMNSSGHRANILSASHLRIGVAAYRTENGTIFWCQQFRQ